MGHVDSKTTQIYADYAPSDSEVAIVEAAFAARAPNGAFMVQCERH
jgi:hypothetical protein